jgi:hypothetical protein
MPIAAAEDALLAPTFSARRPPAHGPRRRQLLEELRHQRAVKLVHNLDAQRLSLRAQRRGQRHSREQPAVALSRRYPSEQRPALTQHYAFGQTPQRHSKDRIRQPRVKQRRSRALRRQVAKASRALLSLGHVLTASG